MLMLLNQTKNFSSYTNILNINTYRHYTSIIIEYKHKFEKKKYIQIRFQLQIKNIFRLGYKIEQNYIFI